MDATASNAPHAAGSLAYRSISSLASSTPAAYFAVPGQTTFFDDLPRDVKIEILGSAELTHLDLARLEDLPTLKLMHQRGEISRGSTKKMCLWAARGGHLEVLRWARANGYWWDASTRQRAGISMCCSGRSQTDARGAYAAEGGQLDVLQWARANGCPWDGSTCAGAAEGGHLDVLQWARANGCPWNETTCEYAVKGGKFELYKWARANGCTWIGRWRIWSAMQNGHHHLARWIKAIA